MGGSNSKQEEPQRQKFKPYENSQPSQSLNSIPPVPKSGERVSLKMPAAENRTVYKAPNLEKIKVGRCGRCLQSKHGFRLGCEHEICSNCLVNYVYSRSYNTLQGRVKCYECDVMFDCDDFFKKFSDKNEKPARDSNAGRFNKAERSSEIGKVKEDEINRRDVNIKAGESVKKAMNLIAEKPVDKVMNLKAEEPAKKAIILKPEESKNPISSSKPPKKCQNIICNSSNSLLELSCGDIYCTNCIKSEALKQTNNTLADKVSCPRCNQFIFPHFIDQAFGGSSAVKRIIEKASEEAILKLLNEEEVIRHKPKFKCELCYSVINVEEGITLDCEHRFCESCIKGYIEFKISNNEVREDQMVCPQCQQSEIQQPIIKAITTPELYEKYEKFTMIIIKPMNPKEIKKTCPFCEAIYYINKDSKEITCIVCRKTYCPQCNQTHSLMSCQEYAKMQEKKKDKDEIDKVKQDLGEFAQCPCCKEGMVLEKGCKFMKCRWPQCTRKPYFCFVCGKELRKNQHYSHYKKNGPFGETCNTIDNIAEA
jgi:hypothetical protein